MERGSVEMMAHRRLLRRLTGENMVGKKFLVCVLAVFASLVHGASDASGGVFMHLEGDSVTLHTVITMKPIYTIKWYFNDIRIAQISGDLSYICTDVQCNEGTERFSDRLKLDHQTGSLTIMNISITDSGEYLQSINHQNSYAHFNVFVHGVSAAERDQMRRKTVKEGESVTLDPGVRNPYDVMMWYFNDTLIAKITGDLSDVYTNVQCNERFRDRLKLDNQTGSLTITHTTNTDSGEYTLQINSGRIIITRSFSVSVTDQSDRFADPGSGGFSGVVAGIVVAGLLLAAAAVVGVIYWRHRSSKK
ncbi:hypothetical protein R3I93_016862 [Phoxinus phoxinus]|uniref:Immunoglobulin domain-containing protein n=1 Tax=Phoxinus phoxinus TaxID=58324 RepID=A0AAN9CI90_9TELE